MVSVLDCRSKGINSRRNAILNPSYTMHLLQVGEDSKIVIMELGFAQFGIGILGVLSLLREQYRSSVAISYGFFMMGASYIHITRFTNANFEEMMSLAGDLVFVVIALLYLVHVRPKNRVIQ